MLCPVVKYLGSGQSTQEVGWNILDYVSCFSLHFFDAIATSCMLYNRTMHSQGFAIFYKNSSINVFSIDFNT